MRAICKKCEKEFGRDADYPSARIYCPECSVKRKVSVYECTACEGVVALLNSQVTAEIEMNLTCPICNEGIYMEFYSKGELIILRKD